MIEFSLPGYWNKFNLNVQLIKLYEEERFKFRDNIIIDNLNTNIQELKETTEKQNEIIVKQTKSIETRTKQVKDLQSTIDSMSQDMITTPDGDDITTG